MNSKLELKNTKFTDETLRWIEIYKIINTINQKIYIGQAVSHIRKKTKFIPHGMEGRFRTHIYEALNNKTKYGCRNLNNAIKKYGKENFTLQLLHNCNFEDANHIESEEIIKHNSLSPHGYNLTITCKVFGQSTEYRQSVSSGIMNSFIDKRITKMLGFKLNICDNYDDYINPQYRNKIQTGWSIRFRDIVLSDIKIRSNKVLEFSSLLITLEENKKRAIEFLKHLKELNNGNVIKLRETTLEPLLPLTLRNICEELV